MSFNKKNNLQQFCIVTHQEPTSTELENYRDFILSCCDENSDGRVSFDEMKLLLVG